MATPFINPKNVIVHIRGERIPLKNLQWSCPDKDCILVQPKRKTVQKVK